MRVRFSVGSECCELMLGVNGARALPPLSYAVTWVRVWVWVWVMVWVRVGRQQQCNDFAILVVSSDLG